MIKELIINYHLTEMSVNKIKYKFINYDQLFNVKNHNVMYYVNQNM